MVVFVLLLVAFGVGVALILTHYVDAWDKTQNGESISAKQFFYKIGDDTIGPLNSQQLRDAVARGEVQQDTLIQVEEGGPTVPAHKVDGLLSGVALSRARPSEPPMDPTGSGEAREHTEERSLPPDAGEPGVGDSPTKPDQDETESPSTSSSETENCCYWCFITTGGPYFKNHEGQNAYEKPIPNGEPVGPLSLKTLFSLAKQGGLKSDSLVWHDELDDWVPAGSVPKLAAIFDESPQTISPPPYPVWREAVYRKRDYTVMEIYAGFLLWGGVLGIIVAYVMFMFGIDKNTGAGSSIFIGSSIVTGFSSIGSIVTSNLIYRFIDFLKDTHRQRYVIEMLTQHMMRSPKD